MLANQTQIEKLLKQVYKEEKNGDLIAEKKPHLKEWKLEKQKAKTVMGMKLFALQSGKDPEKFAEDQKVQAANSAERGKKMRKYCFGAIMLIVIYRKLIK